MRYLTVVLLVGVLTAAVSTGTAPGRTTAPEGTDPGVTLVDLDPWVGARTTVTATIATAGMPQGATLTPILYGAVDTRSAFELTTQGRNLLDPVRELPRLEPARGSDTLRVRFTVTDGTGDDADGAEPTVVLDRAGVHPLVFTAHDADGVEIARLVCYVVRLPDAAEGGDGGRHPLAVATQFRLQPRPTADAQGNLTLTAAATDAARALIDGVETADTTTRSAIGWTVSPAFVDAATRTGHDDLVAGLAAVTTDAVVQPQPWSPVALGGWLATPDLGPQLDRALTQGTATLQGALHTPDGSVTDLAAWGSATSTDALDWFHTRGTRAFLVPAELMDPLDTTTFPRSLAAPFLLDTGAGDVTAIGADDALSTHFTERDPGLGANHLIADLSVIALDLPAMRRGVVVTPPADWRPSADLVARYLGALGGTVPDGSAPLLDPTPLDTLIRDTPVARSGGDTATSGPELVRSLTDAAAATALTGLGRAVQDADGLIDSLQTMAPGDDEATAAQVRRLHDQVALAAMPDEPEARRSARFSDITEQVTATASAIRLPERQTITLTSTDASLPITIRRDEDGPTRMKLLIDAPDRLTFPEGRARVVDLDDTVTRVDVRVHADSPGDTLIRLTVTSPDERLVAGTTEVMVRSTAASGVGLIISFGSLAFLIVWWARDIVRARRRRRARHVPPADLIDID